MFFFEFYRELKFFKFPNHAAGREGPPHPPAGGSASAARRRKSGDQPAVHRHETEPGRCSTRRGDRSADRGPPRDRGAGGEADGAAGVGRADQADRAAVPGPHRGARRQDALRHRALRSDVRPALIRRLFAQPRLTALLLPRHDRLPAASSK